MQLLRISIMRLALVALIFAIVVSVMVECAKLPSKRYKYKLGKHDFLGNKLKLEKYDDLSAKSKTILKHHRMIRSSSVETNNVIVSGQQSYYVIQGGKLVESAVSPTVEAEDEESIEDTEVQPINLIKTTYGWIQGFCFLDFRSPRLYTENFILEGDGKSQVAATMMIMIGGNTNITCVEVLDKTNGTVPPRILRGGEGYNYVKVSVSPSYGIGFDFSVNIYGVVLA